MEIRFLKDALFAAMTANAFKLGTVLSLGWFWMRPAGCTLLYRGKSIDELNLSEILCVSRRDAEQMSPPYYLEHASGLVYYYLVRRANSCGDEEQALCGAVMVSIDAAGGLAAPQPNGVLSLMAERFAGNKIWLVWYYWPACQQARPRCFRIHYDGGTGQIDYENQIGTIEYRGARYHSWQTGPLEAGRYQFIIQAQDDEGTQGGCSPAVSVEVDYADCEAVGIVDARAV